MMGRGFEQTGARKGANRYLALPKQPVRVRTPSRQVLVVTAGRADVEADLLFSLS